MRTDELDFQLPPELIAQLPAPDRAASRLLHYQREKGGLTHRRFSDLPGLLRPGDLLVFNDAKVTPARFYLRKPTGGRLEGLFLGELGETPGGGGRTWSVLLRNLGPTPPGTVLRIENADVEATLLERQDEGMARLAVRTTEDANDLLDRVGRMPLPPYIKRGKDTDDRDAFDKERYQTVYAKVPGSVAAPTAGLHFTPEILADLSARGIGRAFVTLHVGLGTFKPVTSDTVEGHTMHVEQYTLPATTCDAINAAKREGRRVIAVGTTAARVLESQPEGDLTPVSSETGIYIYPPYRCKHVQALITNFHLPRSTLIALVGAFVGLEAQRRIYAEAIAHQYRFFSYGDSSFLE